MDSSQHSYLQLSQEVRYELPENTNIGINNTFLVAPTSLRKRSLGERKLVEAERLIDENEPVVSQPQPDAAETGGDENLEKKRERKDVENIAPYKLEGEHKTECQYFPYPDTINVLQPT